MSDTAPKPTGKYAVGTFTYTVYNDRAEVLEGHQGEKRSIAARVYYPISKESVPAEKEKYMSREVAAALQRAYMVPIPYDKIEKNGENVSECYRDIPRIPGEKFPLILYNHGYQSYREGNSYLCIELASHGYVVISVTHSYEALLCEFDDGTSIPFDKKLSKKMYDPMLPGLITALRLTKKKGSHEELRDAFDQFQNKYCKFLTGRVTEWEKDSVAALNFAKEHFDFIDFELGVGATGHSMGGATAYSLCHNVSDVVCGVNIDGGLFGEYGEKKLAKPFLQINCPANVNVVTRAYANHAAPVYKVVFRDMKHIGFTDMKFKIPMKSMAGKLPAELMHENLCRCHLEFFDTYLKKLKQEPEIRSNDVITVETF